MKLLTKFNLILLLLFGPGGWLISHMAYTFLVDDARRQVMQEAELMLASATAVQGVHDFQPCAVAQPSAEDEHHISS